MINLKDEIKETLEYLKNDFYTYGETYIKEKCKIVTKKESHQLLDYITNLQQENENIISTSLAYDLAVARVKELEYRINKAIEYINNSSLNNWLYGAPDDDLLEILGGDE